MSRKLAIHVMGFKGQSKRPAILVLQTV